MDNVIIVVNGKPRSGKDSFCKFVADYCEQNNIYCDVWSTIDLEKEILEEYIKPYDVNSDNDRGFLHDFKQLLNEYYDITFNDFKAIADDNEGITLIHSREWNEILRFKKYCEEQDIKFISVFVTGKNENNEFTNWGDKFCDDKKNLYDYKIENNGSLEDLKKNAEKFCKSKLF